MPNELVVRKENLPATIEELKKFVIVTKKRIEAHKVQIDAIKRLGLSKSVYDRKMKETQYMSEVVLYAEAKMGKLLKDIPRNKGVGSGGGKKGKMSLSSTGGTKSTPLQKTGIGKTDRMRAEILANNEDAIEEVVEEEISKGNIPTREKVFRKVRENEVVKYREALKKRAKTYEKELPLVVHDDFYEYCMNTIKPNSIDHIITDPPYPAKYLYLYSQLGEVAQRVLKPSGFCMTYAGTYYLKEVINRMSEHDLEYYWQICMRLAGAVAKVYQRNIYQGFRGILIFQKKPIKKQRLMISDYIESPGREKELHQWQQSLHGFIGLLEKFTEPNQIVLEPFAGSGTVGVACMKMSRKCILIDNDIESVKITKARLRETWKEMK